MQRNLKQDRQQVLACFEYEQRFELELGRMNGMGTMVGWRGRSVMSGRFSTWLLLRRILSHLDIHSWGGEAGSYLLSHVDLDHAKAFRSLFVRHNLIIPSQIVFPLLVFCAMPSCITLHAWNPSVCIRSKPRVGRAELDGKPWRLVWL